jgi:phosphatidylinositol glycan class F
MSSTATVTKPQKARLAASTIDILNNDTAHIYSHIHPILVLSLYAFQFKSIVADPVPALLNTLIPLSILQIAYVSICLPATGASSAPPVVKPGVKKKPGASKLESSIQGKIVVRETILHTPNGLC